jgi:GDPmannose 4,6-dehydratase
MKKAFITGITGQDGSYLAEFLINKGYEVHGLVRRSSSFNTSRLRHIFQDPHVQGAQLRLHYGDLSDSSRLTTLLSTIKPDEIYNLAAQSHVRVSFDEPENTGNITGLATARLLEAIRLVCPESKFYQASSSEMFGASPPPQSEDTPFYPRSPYGVAKVYSYWLTKNYREAYGLFAANGVLFNHESPRRGETFVTRKITQAAARISLGEQDKLYLGNLESIRDWGYAPEYVEAMWLMLQLEKPTDLVVATGQATSVREFLEYSFESVGLDWREYVEIDPRYFRPTEVDSLIGDYSKTNKLTGWAPSISIQELAKIMTFSDLERCNNPDHLDKYLWRY